MTNRAEVSSPCIRNCCLDLQDICVGCKRSIDEILAWGNANSAERLIILEQAEKRRSGQSQSHQQNS
ncbi:DUF1289 domain-containing protein [Brumicola nitratireducens]|uniref:DUF1289 domain-containing protein n=1 Tax=Brumicola nitratireducens TaxID=300231 RepID=UPI000A021E61|nr:DUF1289 domain-containing protein [Glaciecola nitratireducens]